MITKYKDWNLIRNYVEETKYRQPELWDNELSEEENVNFMIDYFTKYPNEMKFVNVNVKQTHNIKPPILQNIGGVSE